MKLSIEPRKGVPLYFQIIEEIKHHVAVGELKPGDRLPTVRQLAVELAINPNTVAKAYDELRREGILDVKQGIGTFVKGGLAELGAETRNKKLHQLCEAFVLEGKKYGYTVEDIIGCLENLK
ncbi:MAG: GntR family transcriptional regulator [Calditrichaeota bacterium]|nr:GntR family transcriptional regulator [Calditrichota bacterium]